ERCESGEARHLQGEDVPDHPLAPRHREGHGALRERPSGVPGDARRHQAGDQGRGGRAVQREGARGEHAGGQGQGEAVPRPGRPAVGLEKSDGQARRRAEHRPDDRARV
ncbi:MAG: LSU ribosomal protein L23p (L23Ae), partial [uncultured Acetobacteraceae bacterium]